MALFSLWLSPLFGTNRNECIPESEYSMRIKPIGLSKYKKFNKIMEQKYNQNLSKMVNFQYKKDLFGKY